MISFEITDVKILMKKLLKEQMFDEFEVSSVDITTFTKFSITCDINDKYLSSDETEILGQRSLVTWSEIKDILYHIIKGNKAPTKLKIIFVLPKDRTRQLVEKNQLPVNADGVNGLFININFENNLLKCTTGTSLKIFTLDKTLENYWDETVKKFFKKHGIAL